MIRCLIVVPFLFFYAEKKHVYEKEMASRPLLLFRESHGQGSLAGYSPQSRKEQDTTWQLNNSNDIHTHTHTHTDMYMGFPDSSVGKESACNAGHISSIPGSGRSTGEGIGYPLQDSCLENSMDYTGSICVCMCVCFGVTVKMAIFVFIQVQVKD